MSAPEEKFEAYNAERWVGIKDILSSVDVDADQVIVTSAFGDKNGLRAELERLAHSILELDRNKNPTSKQIAKPIQKAVVHIAAAQKLLDDVASLHWPRRGLYKPANAKLAEAASGLRSELEILVPPSPTELPITRRRSSQNAATAKTIFMRHALQLLDDAVRTEKRSLSRNLTVDFLRACTDPVFPKTTATAISRWIDRHRKK
jgi:hypothetical protein